MKFTYTIVLAIVGIATAIPNPEPVPAALCGSPKCSRTVAKRQVVCPLSCQIKPCTKFYCPDEEKDIICGKYGDSCAEA
nr:hypothetical protein [Paramyrothecium sp.]